ncbi:MAG: hypothetical protein RLZZ546_1739 [Bacteroidota bacterium]|jgi:cellobiose phosphorylase
MLAIKQAKMLLAQMGMTEEQTNKYEALAEPFIEYHKFLMEKLDISSEAAEALTETFSKKYVSDKIQTMVTNGEDLTNFDDKTPFILAAEAVKEMALSYHYDTEKVDVLQTNMGELLDLLIAGITKIPTDIK